MTYLIMTYGTANDWPGTQDELIDARVLADPVNTRRIGPGDPTAGEPMAACWVVECESFDRATELGARLVHGHDAYADVRPVR